MPWFATASSGALHLLDALLMWDIWKQQNHTSLDEVRARCYRCPSPVILHRVPRGAGYSNHTEKRRRVVPRGTTFEV
uniref:Secreted protein n=1 Tax=Romanomermis culicivorax TaxID=13658 RepID=A0A915I6Q3_ROMCU